MTVHDWMILPFGLIVKWWNHCDSVWWSKTTYLISQSIGEKEKGQQTPNPLQKSLVTKDLPLGSTSWGPKTVCQEDQASNTGTFGWHTPKPSTVCVCTHAFFVFLCLCVCLSIRVHAGTCVHVHIYCMEARGWSPVSWFRCYPPFLRQDFTLV